MSLKELEREFDARRNALPGTDDIQRRRRAALEAFASKGFPTRRDEDWHYTDLKPIATAGFEYGPAAGAGAESAAALPADVAPPENTAHAVFVDGRLDERLSRLTGGSGVELVRLADDPARLGTALARRPALEGHPLAQLNTAFTADGVSIRARTEVEEPVYLYFIGRQSGLAAQPRVTIEVEPSASLRVVVHCLDTEHSPASWLNLVIHAAVAEGGRLSLYRLQEHAPAFFETSLLAAELAKDARLEAGCVELGGRLVRNDIDVKLLEPGAEVSLFGVFVAGEGKHIDTHTRIDHIAPHTTSDAVFRGIADRGGRGIFNGKVVVHADAQRIDARQSSDNLLLADGAEIDTKPELEIYADDVKCSHGATVGELDPEQLFYLRARGIDEPQARALLTFAFANKVLARLEPPELRERATARVAGRLPSTTAAEVTR
jgi:Fe-S cluster assembly protein SufD